MLSPFDPRNESGSYYNLKARIFARLQSARVNDHVFEVVQMAYEEALTIENVVLSRPERKRLLSQIVKLVLEDMLKNLEDDSSSA